MTGHKAMFAERTSLHLAGVGFRTSNESIGEGVAGTHANSFRPLPTRGALQSLAVHDPVASAVEPWMLVCGLWKGACVGDVRRCWFVKDGSGSAIMEVFVK